MKITVTGSLGNISGVLVKKLVAAAHEVKVISSDVNKSADIEKLGATPLIGSVQDNHFIKKAFEGSDAVYLMIPPNFATPDYKQFTITAGKNYAEAVQKNGIEYVVNLSSSGSAMAGQPPLVHYQNMETWLDALPNINVMHLRPGGFYTNFYGSIAMIKQMEIIGNNFPGNANMIMSHPADIADAAADAFNSPVKGRHVKYIISDTKTGSEATHILGTAIGKPGLQWMQFSDEQLLQALMQNGFSKDAAQHYIVDMGIAIREGLLDEHYKQHAKYVYGKRSFNEFAQEFAFAFKG